MPIERAVPSMIFMACSTSFALRSGIFISAISRTWARVTRPTFSLFGIAAARLDAGGPLEQRGGQRRLRDEGEAAVLEDRDLGRDDVAAQVGGPLVEGLDELHDVDAVLAEGRPDRGRRGGGAGRRLHLEHRPDLLCHLNSSRGSSGADAPLPLCAAARRAIRSGPPSVRIGPRASRSAGSRARPASRGRRC